MSKKSKIHKPKLAVSIGILLLSVVAVVLGFSLNDGINDLVTQKKEAERPANIKAVLIGTPDCLQCQQVISLYQQGIPKQANIVYSSQEEIDPESDLARELIVKYEITKLPALVLTGEIEKDDKAKSYLNTLGQLKQGAIVISGLVPPYQNVSDSKVVGEYKIILLTDSTCTSCYDVNLHKNILSSFGMYPFEEEEVDSNTTDGKRLIAKYNIQKVPTILLEGDLDVYLRLGQIWKDVGRVADDNTYVFEAVERMGTYKDLILGKIVEAKSQNPQSVHNHVNFLVFIEGEQFDFANDLGKYFVKDQKVHLENSDIKGAAGKVIHVHSQGMTMRGVFETLGWKLTDTCLSTDQGDQLCNEGGKTLKVYKNGELDDSLGDQELQQGDKYLISFGSQGDSVLKGQVEEVPDYAY